MQVKVNVSKARTSQVGGRASQVGGIASIIKVMQVRVNINAKLEPAK